MRPFSPAAILVFSDTFYPRITSYNVCYTKLLRVGGRDVKALYGALF